MSEMTNVNIRMDKELKKQFETFLQRCGDEHDDGVHDLRQEGGARIPHSV